uniref:Uncharacterized protein n=1 Tax=Siphoviridae sp. ctKcB20 TaxID=2827568 RepID=A0A8S5LLC1_9CAUD|nr:MAG TPA: hypothetical protein [Siphoviridae sp. ctKcB20]
MIISHQFALVKYNFWQIDFSYQFNYYLRIYE